MIKRGGIVAFPTETVYGLGADVFNRDAIGSVFTAKLRPADNPLIAHISSVDQIGELATLITPSAQKLIAAFFPGPLTVVVPKTDRVPPNATAGLDTIGIRMPRSSPAKEFLAACGTAVVAPSANLSGRPSPTTWQAVLEDLDGRIDCILQGEPTEIGLESTVVDCTGDVPVLLRKGAISIEEVRGVVPETVAAADPSLELRSPGLRHKHYSPSAGVLLIGAHERLVTGPDTAYIGIAKSNGLENLGLVRLCGTIEEYVHSVFEFFRECDRAGIKTIYCETVPETGLGAALMDRLRRAANG